ncbi:heterokaryon incompatibility protein-domain-containing protein [Pseudoneurospora amorphoporcata]|uniref:Heterokaryon incompatibility protein-domain-containing protein n=1 Tax=Pseudoneurospora amorphoporcata TaxID=241081 RepID=A0AAN6P6T1_9PEZI|nr:heterokaryon incompatibility protein-domain-containing protein [Pseudoneurospora amorphoporcata]
MICSVCQTTLQAAISHFRLAKNQDERHFVRVTLNDPPDEWYTIKDHHKTLNSFMDSVDQGCHICSFIRFWLGVEMRPVEVLWRQIETGEVSNSYGNAATQLLMNYRKHQDYECFTFSFRFLSKAQTSDAHPMFGWEDQFREWQHVLEFNKGKTYAVPTYERSTGSLQAQLLLKEWVSDCVVNHTQCRPPKCDTSWYPTRLLDLSEPTDVRLIETKDTKPAGPYVTVTHRWGHVDEEYVLNKRKHPLLIKGIPLDSLPRLFQDVISVVRTLGVRYLWIDSLCIMQDKDDKSDWENEASLMEKVYSHSYCNISAADAENCSRSLFNVRHPQSVNPETLTLDLVNDESDVVTPVQFYAYNCQFWLNEVSNALVNTRAWVLQEHILAPRVLHFGGRQLMWECCEKNASEVFPHGLHPELSASEDVRFKSFALEVEQNDQRGYLDTSTLPLAQLLWSRIIFDYSCRDLSRPEDKLIACSGVAKRFQSLLQDTYVAGMWRTNLEDQLLWRRHPDSTGSRSGAYRTPTWSWASLDAIILPPEWPQDGCQIEAEDVHLTYATSDKTGGITDGWLRLRGVLLETKLVKSRVHESAFDLYLEGETIAATLTRDNRVSPVALFDIPRDIVDYEEVEGRVYSMIGHAGTTGWSSALLLFKIVDEQRGVFERIGIANILAVAQKEEVLSIKREPGKSTLPCAEFKDGKHTIIVI